MRLTGLAGINDGIIREWKEITRHLGADIIVLENESLFDSRKFRTMGDLGKLLENQFLSMLSYVAEQERKKTKQRQAEGIEVAIKNGIRFGRPKQEITDEFRKVVTLWKAGEITAVAAMKQLDMKPNTFYRRVKEYERLVLKMYVRVRELLTPEERLQYLQIPPDLGEWELGTYFTLTHHDLELIGQRRRDYNRLGFAVQLCVLRYLGWTLSDVKEVPVQVLRYVAKQINADVESFASYGEREATKYEHLEEIRKEYGYQTFTLSEYRSLCKHLFNHAMANGNPLHLIQLALEDLRKRKIILPSMSTIERAVWETRKRTEEKIFKLLSISLTDLQISKLDRVLTTMPESSKTYLAWLREIPGTSSPDSFLKVIEKLEYIRDLQLQVDTKGIHPNRQRQLSKIGARYEPHSYRRFNDPKKYAILVAYLLELIQDLTD